MRKRILHNMTRLMGSWLIIAVTISLIGCASAPPAPHKFTPPVYPKAPDPARFIYERTFLYNEDVEKQTTRMKFKQFALGASKKLRGLVKPFDVAVHQGRVYVTDTVQRSVIVFDVPGKRYQEIGTTTPGELQKPMGIDVSKAGILYVCDISAQRVMSYNQAGEFIRALGEKDELQRPTDLALSPEGDKLYVVDTGGVDSDKHHVHVYDTTSGDKIMTIGQRGIKDGEFNFPLQAAVNKDGILYVVDGGNFRVQSFNSDGSFRASFGSVGRFPGQFSRPKGISIDPDGNLYIVDAAFGNIQIFNPDGQLLMFIGERGQAGIPGKYMLPAGIDVDSDGRIYVVDQFFRKIDVFRPVGLAIEAGYLGQTP